MESSERLETPAGVPPHGYVSPTLKPSRYRCGSARLRVDHWSNYLEQYGQNVSRSFIRRLLLRTVCQVTEVCIEVGLQHSKLETMMLGSPTIFPQRLSLRVRSKMNTKADVDLAWNCFIGRPSNFQGLEMSIPAHRPALPAVLTPL